MHRRLRWGNVARTAGAVAVVAVVVAWPRLAPPDPAMPGNEAAPLAGDEPAWMPPRAPGREDGQARSRRERTPRGGQRGGGSGRGAPGARRVTREGSARGAARTRGEDGSDAWGRAARKERARVRRGRPMRPGAVGRRAGTKAVRRGRAPGNGGGRAVEARAVRRRDGGADRGPADGTGGGGTGDGGGSNRSGDCARPGRDGVRVRGPARPRRRRRGPWRGCRRSARRSSRPDLGR